MREDLNLKNYFNAGGKLTYCFEIYLSSKKTLYLTSADQAVYSNNRCFLPASGLIVKEAKFNDSAVNTVIVSGIFEDNGITNETNLLSAEVQIFLLLEGKLCNFLSYYVTNCSKFDHNFTIILEPETIKYQKSFVKKFSKTCRANLADQDCMVDISKYQYEAIVVDIISNKLTIKELNLPNDHLSDGLAINLTQNERKSFKIIEHKENNLLFSENITSYFAINDKIILSPGCDKKFITCCNKFNNEVNFRGEPFIPIDNHLYKS